MILADSGEHMECPGSNPERQMPYPLCYCTSPATHTLTKSEVSICLTAQPPCLHGLLKELSFLQPQIPFGRVSLYKKGKGNAILVNWNKNLHVFEFRVLIQVGINAWEKLTGLLKCSCLENTDHSYHLVAEASSGYVISHVW